MNPELLALSIIVLLFSVIVHEVMHGLTALKFGDHTAERAGRLTLNPLPHIDPVGTILLPILLFVTNSPIMFGWAKPVPVNPLNFTDLRKGEFLVSIAGILSNLALALIAAVIYHILRNFGAPFLVMETLFFMVQINILLAIFNFIPIPPLDGSKVLMSQLPYKLAKEYQKFEAYGFIVLLMLWFIPVGGTSLLGFILRAGTSFFMRVFGF
ncbi:site-2 protease family protein [Candidatus Daviesbacteria bacterium]|nr:site-2 protease family protein [Candidatus Daviesbacteria bacterium]